MSIFRNLILSQASKAEDEPEREIDDNGYIIFKDPEAERVLMSVGLGDGVGIKPFHLGNVYAEDKLKNNTKIEYFNELKYFKNPDNLGSMNWGTSSAFEGCTNLKEVTLPTKVLKLGYRCFHHCDSLVKINGLSEQITYLRGLCLNYTALKEIYLPKLTSWESDYGMFQDMQNLERVLSLGSVDNVKNNWDYYLLGNCPKLKYAFLPRTIKTFGNGVFRNSTNLEFFVLPTPIVPNLAENNITGYHTCSAIIYVLDELVDSFKTATKWSSFANMIRPISECSLYDDWINRRGEFSTFKYVD